MSEGPLLNGGRHETFLQGLEMCVCVCNLQPCQMISALLYYRLTIVYKEGWISSTSIYELNNSYAFPSSGSHITDIHTDIKSSTNVLDDIVALTTSMLLSRFLFFHR